MKVIIDTNLWISFLIGHQTQFLRLLLTDTRFDVYVCNQLIDEICKVAKRDKILSLAEMLTLQTLNAISEQGFLSLPILRQ